VDDAGGRMFGLFRHDYFARGGGIRALGRLAATGNRRMRPAPLFASGLTSAWGANRVRWMSL